MDEYVKSAKRAEYFAFLNHCANALMASKEDHWNFRMADESWLMEDVNLDDVEALVIFREMFMNEQDKFLSFTLDKTETEEATVYVLHKN